MSTIYGNPILMGAKGADGTTPHIGANGNWYLGTTDTGKPSRGATGPQGPQGPRGNPASVNGVTPDNDGNIKLSASNVGAAKTNHDHMGKTINPAGIELFPGTTAGHGGYIDFHYKNSDADFTSRIIEVPSGYVTLNGMGIMTRANIAAAYNVQAQFTNGIFEYSNSVIKAGTICFAQFRGGLVTSSFRDTALATTSDAGKVKIVAKNGETFNTNLNVLMINL